MSRTQRAFLSWIPPEAGGRKSPPAGPRYVTVARFEQDENWPHEAWSLVVTFVRSFRQDRYTLAEISFLADGAPEKLLDPGGRFELLEGRRRVAKGVVLPGSVQVPEHLNDFELALIG